MDFIIITNNNKVYNFYKETNDVFYFQKKDFLDLLEIVKEEIYKGHKLLSDPIMYNLVSKDTFSDDGTQKKLIDGVISIARKIPNRKNFSEFSETTLEEFRFIDLNLLTDGTKSFSY